MINFILSKIRVERTLNIVLLLFLILAILPFFLLTYYNYPSIHDDYSDANSIIKYGKLRYIIGLYNTWTGRYSELILKAYLSPLIYKNTALLARVQPMIFIALFTFSSYCLFWQVMNKARAFIVIVCALLFVTIYLNGLESVGASFYWFGGYTSFTTGIIASLFSYATIISLYRCKKNIVIQTICLLCGALFSTISIGAYDVSMMTTCWVLGSIVLLAWIKGEAVKWWYLALIGLSTIGIYMAVAAPGNQGRAAELGHDFGQIVKSPQLFIIFTKSIYFAITQIFSWINSLILVLGSFLIVVCLNHGEVGANLEFKTVHPIVFGLWLLGGIAASVFPSVLVYQSVWEHSWQCVYLYFLVGWIYLLNILYIRYLAKFTVLKKTKIFYCGFGIYLTMCFFSGTSNTHLAYMDIMTYAPDYYKKVRQRELKIKEHYNNHMKTVKLTPLYSNDEKWRMPKTLYTLDFNNDDALQYAKYYGIDSVKIR